MSMAAGARAGARVLQQLRSPTPFLSRAQLLPHSSPSSSASSLTPSSRGFSADHHGPARVNIWEAPTDPARWKEEHFVFVSLAGWFSLFYGGYRAATRQSKPKPPTKGEPPPKAVRKSDPVLKKPSEKSASRKEEPRPKSSEKPVLKKTEEKTVAKKEELIAKSSEKPVLKKKEEKAVAKKEELIAKSSGTPVLKKKEEKPVSKKEEKVPPIRKGERPVPKNEGDVPKRGGERPTPKTGDDVAKRKAEQSPPKSKEEKKAEQNPKDRKGAYKLVKVDDEENFGRGYSPSGLPNANLR